MSYQSAVVRAFLLSVDPVLAFEGLSVGRIEIELDVLGTFGGPQ